MTLLWPTDSKAGDEAGNSENKCTAVNSGPQKLLFQENENIEHLESLVEEFSLQPVSNMEENVAISTSR